MKALTVISRLLRFGVYLLWGCLLLPVAVALLLYSPWGQDLLRVQLLRTMNSKPGVQFTMRDARIRFPLTIHIDGMAYTSAGDTLMAAETFDGEVAMLPLLRASVEVKHAEATGARYTLGAPDSLLYMHIAANRLTLKPARVNLAQMDIALSQADLYGGDISLTIKPDTSSKPKPPTPPTRMTIKAHKLGLHDFTYRLRMVPTIDSLACHIDNALLTDGTISLLHSTVDISSFEADGVRAAYIACDSATIADTPVGPNLPSTSAPWTININRIHLSRTQGLYTTRGVKPQPGLDFAYLQADSMDLTIDSFYNRASEIRLPITFSGRERCGIDVRARGTFAMADSMMHFEHWTVTTPRTSLTADGSMGMGDLLTDPKLPLKLQAAGRIGVRDLKAMFPYLNSYLSLLPGAGQIGVDMAISGTPSQLNIARMNLQANNIINLKANGRLNNILNSKRFGADMKLSGHISPSRDIVRAVLTPELAAQYNIPPMSLDGHVMMHGQNYAAKLSATTHGGTMALDGQLNGSAESYKLDATLRRFPVNAFAPTLGVGRATGRILANGHGFDPMSRNTVLNATVRIDSAVYDRSTLHDINLAAQLDRGNAVVDLRSAATQLRGDVHLAGNLLGSTYSWTGNSHIDLLDLKALGFSDVPATLAVGMNFDADYTGADESASAHLQVGNLLYRTDDGDIAIDNLSARLTSDSTVTNAMIQNRDSYMFFSSEMAVRRVLAQFADAGTMLARQYKAHAINIDSLQRVLPPFMIDLRAGTDNFINDILHRSGMHFQRLRFEAGNYDRLTLNSKLMGFTTGTTRLDTITLKSYQQADTLMLQAHMGNRPGNLDAWKQVDVTGNISHGGIELLLDQRNAAGRRGFRLGTHIAYSVPDTTFTVRLRPYDPMIGYQQWQVNEDNFVSYNLSSGHIDANLQMTGGKSSLSLYTKHNPDHEGQEDLMLKLGNIQLQDWIALNPFAPPIRGSLSADMRLQRHDDDLQAQGNVTLQDLYYDRRRVGTVTSDLKVITKPTGELYADADLGIDGRRTMTLRGNLNNAAAGTPLELQMQVISFPLTTLNPFLPEGTASLRGVLNGQLDIAGQPDNPTINGTLRLDSTAVRVDMTGVDYALSNNAIPINNNLLTLRNFTISGAGGNPLRVDGTVNMAQLSNPQIKLTMRGNDFTLVDNRRAAKGATVYGRALVNVTASINGNMTWLNTDASIDLRPGTNVTYIMADAATAITDQTSGEMVRFVNFTDSAAVALADSLRSTPMMLNLRAALNISDGSTVNVDLNPNGTNRVQLQPQGSLDFTMSPLAGMRLTGRVNIPQGYVRYTPPLLTEKYFTFDPESYIAFNGQVMNPQLNILATDQIKANVSVEGQNSRLINFDVGLSVTGNLNTMKVDFDLSTNDDITVTNELASMSPQQRASQAINLLLYNVYTGAGGKATDALQGNPLYSFLESQINTWAASNIKGVDLSFGIDQYNRKVDGATSQAMSYSYQVSKTLFNDRFKIVVGGNYSTDANADENFSQNLINDISFEYFLNNTHSMYARVFRHTGYESIIEGEVTQTGIGFVYRKKIYRVDDIFNFLRRKRRQRGFFSPTMLNMPLLSTAPRLRPDTITNPAEPAK